MIKKITREEEAQIPAFQSHQEARDWFKRKYKDAFMLTDSDDTGDEKWYFYDLILDRKKYEEGRWHIQTPPKSVKTRYALDFLTSYQSIQISEQGHIHIVH